MTAVARRTIHTMCPMNCHPTYCGMVVEVEDDQVLSIRGDRDNPDSRGFLCIRGQAAGEIIDNPLRILVPRMRAPGAGRRAQAGTIPSRHPAPGARHPAPATGL